MNETIMEKITEIQKLSKELEEMVNASVTKVPTYYVGPMTDGVDLAADDEVFRKQGEILTDQPQ